MSKNYDQFYEQCKDGNFKPLINELLTKMRANQEGFTQQGLEKKIKEIVEPKNTIEFFRQLQECLQTVIANNEYMEKAGVYYPNPYNETHIRCLRKHTTSGIIGPSEEQTKMLLRDCAAKLGVEYRE